MSDLKKTIAQIFLIALIKLILSLTEAYEDVPVLIEIPENLSLAETWKSDYEEWDYWNTTHEAELWDKNIQFNHSSWKTSSEDEILYDIYNTQPEEVLEIDEDGLELSDDWLVLDMDEEWQPDENEAEMVNDIKTSINNEENDDSISLEEQSSEVLDCDEEIPKPMKRKKKVSARKQKDDEFYFKHKKYGKKSHKVGATREKKRNWKKNCCIRGKKVGNAKRTFWPKTFFKNAKKEPEV